MMGAPAGRDKDAVFKHKRVAETKGSARVVVEVVLTLMAARIACDRTWSAILPPATAHRLSHPARIARLPLTL